MHKHNTLLDFANTYTCNIAGLAHVVVNNFNEDPLSFALGFMTACVLDALGVL